ncbi:MAG: response regulator [Verrucomicrobiales bacterium]|nr:response regulator [Verrucomicrobiales bacterium]
MKAGSLILAFLVATTVIAGSDGVAESADRRSNRVLRLDGVGNCFEFHADLFAGTPTVPGGAHESQADLDDIRVWNRARSAEEIQSGMFQRLESVEQGVQGWLNFDDPTSPGHDGSGRGDTDVLVGSAIGIEASVPQVADLSPGTWLGTVSGTVLGLDGTTPLSAVVVQLVSANSEVTRADGVGPNGVVREESVAACRTDANGRYRFATVPPGRYRLRCQVGRGCVDYRKGEVLVVKPAAMLRDCDFRLAPFKKGVWRHWAPSDRQPVNLVNAFYQDLRGELWMAGFDGICRFDGRTFVVYGQADGFADMGFTMLASGMDERLWAATEQSIYEYDSTAEAVGAPPFRYLPDPIGRLGLSSGSWWQDPDGTAYLGTARQGIWIWEPGKRPHPLDPELSQPLAITRHPEFGLVVATQNGPRHWDGSRFVPLPGIPPGLASAPIVMVRTFRDDSLWVSAWPGGLWRYERGAWRQFTDADGLGSNHVVWATETDSGVVWITTQDGIVRYDGVGFVHFEVGPGATEGSLPSQDPCVAAGAVAKDGALWFSRRQGGLLRYEESSFTTYTTADGLHTNRLSQVASTSDGSVWMAGADSLFAYASLELTRWDGGQMRVYTAADGLPNSPIWGVATNGLGQLCLGTLAGLVVLQREGFSRPVFHQGIWPDSFAIRLAPASDGGLWVGSANGGVSHFDGQRFSRRFEVPTNMVVRADHPQIAAIHEDAHGRIWFGGWGQYLGCYDGKEVRDFGHLEGIGMDAVSGIANGPDGRVWIGTWDGLFREDGRGLTRVRPSWHEPVPRVVTAVFQDRERALWLGTPHGVRCFDGATWTAIEVTDGLAGNQVTGIQQDVRGDYWFATTSGLTRYRPCRRTLLPPEVALVDKTTSQRAASTRSILRGREVGFRVRAVDFATLPEKRHYRVAFVAGRGETPPSQNDPQWCSYFGLDEIPWSAPIAGETTLFVQVVDRDRNYSPCQAVALTVILPWHENPWILGPAALGVLGLIGTSVGSTLHYRHRRRQAMVLRERLLDQEQQAREAAERSAALLQRKNTDLDRAREAAETANRAKSLFLANMSHEIRTPLHAILGYSQILLRASNLPEKQRHAVETIDRSGQHLLAMINDVLDLSKIEAGRTEFQPAVFDLRVLILGLAEMLRPRCADKGLRLDVVGPKDGPVVVCGDETKLRHVLMNLLGNAVKFTDRGTVTLRVQPAILSGLPGSATPGATDVEGYRFEVHDSGRGIVPEAMATLFQPFQQASEGEREGGWGLGLALARRYVEIMGGRISVTSDQSQGSSFCVELPLPPAAEVPSREPPLREVVGLAPGSRVSALVVDDVAQNREVLSDLLHSLGCCVRTAEDGPRALEQIRAERPDIVFLDIRMPGMDGVEVARRIALEAGPSRPRIIAVSASALAHERCGYAKLGFDAFLAKPFRVDELCDCLGRWLGVGFRNTEPPAADAGSEPTVVLRDFGLPEALRERIRRAAERYSATHLEEALAELAERGDAERQAAAILRRWVHQGRFDAVVVAADFGGSSTKPSVREALRSSP